MVVNSTEERPALSHRNSECFSDACSSSSKPYIDDASSRNGETRAADSGEKLIINTKSEIEKTNISHVASPSIFYG